MRMMSHLVCCHSSRILLLPVHCWWWIVGQHLGTEIIVIVDHLEQKNLQQFYHASKGNEKGLTLARKGSWPALLLVSKPWLLLASISEASS